MRKIVDKSSSMMLKDGMHAISIKKCWSVVDKNVCHMIIVFLKQDDFLRELNKMSIPLIHIWVLSADVTYVEGERNSK